MKMQAKEEVTITRRTQPSFSQASRQPLVPSRAGMTRSFTGSSVAKKKGDAVWNTPTQPFTAGPKLSGFVQSTPPKIRSLSWPNCDAPRGVARQRGGSYSKMWRNRRHNWRRKPNDRACKQDDVSRHKAQTPSK